MSWRSLDDALSSLPPERRGDVEARARQAILNGGREAFREAASRLMLRATGYLRT
jgi:hypothetical protein